MIKLYENKSLILNRNPGYPARVNTLLDAVRAIARHRQTCVNPSPFWAGRVLGKPGLAPVSLKSGTNTTLLIICPTDTSFLQVEGEMAWERGYVTKKVLELSKNKSEAKSEVKNA